jgi:hypothetical protein
VFERLTLCKGAHVGIGLLDVVVAQALRGNTLSVLGISKGI